MIRSSRKTGADKLRQTLSVIPARHNHADPGLDYAKSVFNSMISAKHTKSPLGSQLLKKTKPVRQLSPQKHSSLMQVKTNSPRQRRSQNAGNKGRASPSRTLLSHSPMHTYTLYPKKRDINSEIDYKRVRNIAKELNRLNHVRTYDSLKRKFGIRHLLIPKTHALKKEPVRQKDQEISPYQPSRSLSPLLSQGSKMWKLIRLNGKLKGENEFSSIQRDVKQQSPVKQRSYQSEQGERRKERGVPARNPKLIKSMEGVPIKEESGLAEEEDLEGGGARSQARIRIDLAKQLRNQPVRSSIDEHMNSIEIPQERQLTYQTGSPTTTERLLTKVPQSTKISTHEVGVKRNGVEKEAQLEEERNKLRGLSQETKRLRTEGVSSATNWFQDSHRLLSRVDSPPMLSPKGMHALRPQHTSFSFYTPISPPFAIDKLNNSIDLVNSTYALQPLRKDNSVLGKSPEALLKARDQRSKALVGLLIAEQNRRIMARRFSVSCNSSQAARKGTNPKHTSMHSTSKISQREAKSPSRHSQSINRSSIHEQPSLSPIARPRYLPARNPPVSVNHEAYQLQVCVTNSPHSPHDAMGVGHQLYGKKKSSFNIYADALYNRGIYIKNTSNTPQPFSIGSNADF